MKTIKVIDLLNMISKGEKVPKKIKYENDIYILTDNYCYYCDETNLILSDRLYAEQSRLNDEVEILEEKKKIPEKLNYKYRNMYGHISQHKQSEIDIINTLNGVIDYLKSKGE